MATNFQAESKTSGDEFESIVADDLMSMYDLDSSEIFTSITLDQIGIELDYVVLTDQGIECGEAKGGKPGIKKRPGAERTDNVKKAICNGALLQTFIPGITYVVYFSAEPKPNSSSEAMINAALSSGYVSEVRYLNPYSHLSHE